MAYQCKVVRNLRGVVQRTAPIKSVGIFGRAKYVDNRVLQALTSSTQAQTEGENDKPIKFSDSKAGQWKARYTCYGEYVDKRPRAQQYAIVFSLAAFLIYFCILREENDLDEFLRETETKVPEQLKEAIKNKAANPKTQTYSQMYRTKAS